MRSDRSHEMLQKRDDEQREEVTRAARGYQTQHPDLSWGQCIALAEKHITGRNPESNA
jgi:hypothetical protein